MPKRLRKFIKWFLIASLPLALLITIILGYWLKWDWTGFKGKTLWDWLNLFAIFLIPAAVGFGTLWFTAQQNETQDTENEDNQRERALQEYIDKISDLLLKENLRESVPTLSVDSQFVLKGLDTKPDEEVRTIARAQTLTVLSRLDGTRKRKVLEFLYELGLLQSKKPIVSLEDADLRDTNLIGAHLTGTDLSHADLSDSYLSGANLSNANLSSANLHGANLYDAYLEGADLREADLTGANLTSDLTSADLSNSYLAGANLYSANLIGASLIGASLYDAYLAGADFSNADLSNTTGTTPKQLKQAKSLQGATMPDGSKHP